MSTWHSVPHTHGNLSVAAIPASEGYGNDVVGLRVGARAPLLMDRDDWEALLFAAQSGWNPIDQQEQQ